MTCAEGEGLVRPVRERVDALELDLARAGSRIDFALIATVLALSAFGALMIYSATQGNPGADPFSVFRRQLTWIGFSIVAMALAFAFDYDRWRNLLVPAYLVNLGLLILVLVIGKSGMGAQRWIQIGAFNLQPSELAKVMLVITLSVFLAARKGSLGAKDVLLAFVHVGIPLVLITRQPDLGTALCLVAILLGTLVVAGMTVRHLVVVALVVAVGAIAVFQLGLLHDYQVKRLVVFVNPDVDPLGAGYNLLQSKIAIGSGELTGKGLFSGTQTNLQFLPARHTDFIFSVVGEELGFAGGALLLFLLLVAITRALRIALLARNLTGTLLAAGVASLWLFQVLVNVGMTMGIMPITGIPLPFVSYGGSAMLANYIAVGLLLNVYARRFV